MINSTMPMRVVYTIENFPQRALYHNMKNVWQDIKKSKERVIVLACANVTGVHKSPLVIIGKSKKPGTFKKLKNLLDLPVYYVNQKSVWMNSRIFENWFFNEFVPFLSMFWNRKVCPRKAILLLDNASSCPDASSSDVKRIDSY